MAGTKIYGQLIRAQAESAAADLTPAATGLFYFNSVSTSLKWYTGAAWLTTVDTSTSQVLTNKDYDGGTASNTSRLTIPKASNATLTALTRKQGTVVYDTTANKPLYDNGSTLSSFGSGSGAGEVNAVLNPSAADDLTGWTNGTSHTATRVTSGSPLDPVTTTALSIAATTTAAESSTSGEYYTVTTHPTGLRNKKLKVEFYFTTEASQTWAVSVYSGSTRMVLSTDASGATLLPAGTTGKFTTYVDTDASTSYKINFTRTAGSGTATLLLTSVIFGPGIQPQGAVVTEESLDTGFSFDNFGTVTEMSMWRARSGNRMTVRGSWRVGTAVGAAAAINLPSGFTIDSSKLSSSTNVGLVGYFKVAATVTTNIDASNQSDGAVFYDGSTTGKLFFAYNSGTTARQFNKMNGSNFSNNIIISVNFTIPIAEWSGSGTVNLASNDLEYAFNTSTADGMDLTSFGYGPQGTTFPGTQTGVLTTTRVRFTSPVAGCRLTFQYKGPNASDVWADVAGYDPAVGIYDLQNQNNVYSGVAISTDFINATDVKVYFGKYQYNASTYGANGTNWATGNGYWRVKKEAAGQAVGFGLATTTSAGLLKAGQMPGDISGTAIAAGYIGQKIEDKSHIYSGKVTITSNTFANIGTVALTEGVWCMSFNFGMETSTTASNAISAISTFSGNTTTDHVLGDNSFNPPVPTTALDSSGSLNGYIVSLSTPTTYYGKLKFTHTGSGAGYGRLTAIRIA